MERLEKIRLIKEKLTDNKKVNFTIKNPNSKHRDQKLKTKLRISQETQMNNLMCLPMLRLRCTPKQKCQKLP